MTKQPTRNYLIEHAPKVLREIADHAAHVLMKEGDIDGATALELGRAMAARIAQVFGGCRVNIPKGTWNGGLSCFELAKRDLAIYRAFNGRNKDEVCLRYGICESRLYAINNAVRKQLRNLPDAESAFLL